ncbi:sugar ABC transporter substrate-binding protein [Paenibacillus sp. IB182493]|uniref:Sugar ABC transporter substrate-binding protein n=2 Tax=Paenibacillus arenilitoris TaxID=2772299 RepID=A0A927CL81_9BACL|nr:sugar ABC transporter substrate-binding protein [Paenibacillus arenilitoris]
MLLLSACSGGGSGGNANNANNEADDAAGGAGGKEPITLRLTMWGNQNEVKAFENAIKRFEASHSNVTVKLESIPTDYDTKLTTMIAGNEEPDVAMMESATLAFPLAEEGKFINLEDYLNSDPSFSADKLVPHISYYAEPGNLIGLSPGPETFALYYNVDMFTDAGIEPPPASAEEAWTWDEFVEVAKRLTIDENGKNASEPGFDPKRIRQFGISGANGWWGSWSNFVYGNGGDFVSEDGTTFALNQPEAVEALQKLADLVNVHHVAPSPVQAKNVPGTNIALQTKKVAMVIDGQWANMDLGVTDVNYDIAVLPVIKEPVTTVVGGMFSIFKSTKHPQESWELVKALLDPEGTLELNHKGVWMPAIRSWYEDPALIDKWTKDSPGRTAGYKTAVIDMLLEHSRQTPTGYVKNFNKIMDIVTPALDKVWLGEQSAQEAMDAIADKAQAQVQGRRDIE